MGIFQNALSAFDEKTESSTKNELSIIAFYCKSDFSNLALFFYCNKDDLYNRHCNIICIEWLTIPARIDSLMHAR